MADIFSSHPFNNVKEVKPTNYHCETCDITMKFSDHQAHLRGKKHRARETLIRNREAALIPVSIEEAEPVIASSQLSETACRNCGQEGHFQKDCTEPRSTRNVECRKCQQLGHFAKDCPSGGGRACHNCGQEGHISRECPEPKKPSSIKCRNCDQFGHMGRECPEPKNWAKVQCNNCSEFGHTFKRCSKPKKEEDFGDTSGGWGAPATTEAIGGWDNDTSIATVGDWDTEPAQDLVTFEDNHFEMPNEPAPVDIQW